MQKTSNYNLNKPEVTDPLRVEDFNENAEIIDAAMGVLSGRSNVVVGSFVGTADGGRTLELGFTPKFIMVLSKFSGKGYISMATAEAGWYLDGGSIDLSTSRCVEGGAYIAPNTNDSREGNYYVAVG